MRLFPRHVVRALISSLLILSCAPEHAMGPEAVAGRQAASGTDATSQLIITEVMPDPTKVSDAAGEWFEVYNAGSESVDLMGTRIVSAAGTTATESHTIAASVIVDPGAHVVLG